MLGVSYFYSDSSCGLADETEQISCPCKLMYVADPCLSSTRFFTGHKLKDDL